MEKSVGPTTLVLGYDQICAAESASPPSPQSHQIVPCSVSSKNPTVLLTATKTRKHTLSRARHDARRTHNHRDLDRSSRLSSSHAFRSK